MVLTLYATVTHILIPLLVVGVLHSVSTAPVINSCFVCISVEDVDVAKASAHFYGVISSTAIFALSCITGSLWTRVGANALGSILQASIIVAFRSTVSHTPESEKSWCRIRHLQYFCEELVYQSGVLFLKLL